MADLFKQFATDKNVEKDGIYLDYGKNSKGEAQRIKVARAGGANVRFQKTLDRLTKPHRRMIQNESLDDEVGQEINRKLYADSVVLGWDGILDRDGNPLPYSRENCISLFEQLPDLLRDVIEATGKSTLFREIDREIEAKN